METVIATIMGVMLTALVAAVGWLVRSVIANSARTSELNAAIKELATMADMHQLEVSIADRFVRRDDYVPQMTLTNAKLDAIGTMVARLDERSAG